MNDTTAVLESLDALAAATTRDGLSGRERLTRAGIYRDAAADLAAAAGADPYTAGRGSILVDLLAAGRAQRARRDPDPAVVERLARHNAVTALRMAAIQNQILIDTPGLVTTRPSGIPFEPGLAAAPLLAYATPFTPTGPTIDLPAAWQYGTGALDPVEKTEVNATASTMDTIPTPWHLAAYGVNLSRPAAAWGEDTGRRFEDLIASVVNSTLEAALVADLLGAAGTPAADLDTAEAAAGTAWGAGADTLVVNPADWPAVRRSYPGQPVPFPNVAVTASVAAGTALVFPLAGVHLLADALAWMQAPEPRLLGDAIVAMRSGLTAPRRPGVVAAAVVPTVTP